MHRWKIAGCWGLLCAAVVSTPTKADDISTATRVAALIRDLSDPDPIIRDDSVQRLLNLGDAALPVVRNSISNADAQARSEMNEVLLHIPWVQADDIESVQQAFTGYGQLDDDSRIARVAGWIAPQQDAGGPALLRVLLNDPSGAVRWTAADALRMVLKDNDETSKQLINLVSMPNAGHGSCLPPNENAALLAAAGWAIRDIDIQRADELVEHAIAIEDQTPSAFHSQMDFAYDWLIQRAITRHDYVAAMKLLRQKAGRTAWDAEHVPYAVKNLFAAQADYGPLPGFYDDLRTYQEYLGNAEMIYAMGRLALRRGHPYLSAAINDAALAMNGTSFDDHFEVSDFLSEHEWDDVAERELRWCLYLAHGQSPMVYARLATVAEHRDDDWAAGHYMEVALQQAKDQRLSFTADIDQAGAAVQWHYLRAARSANDQKGERAHLEKLLALDQDAQVLHKDPGMAADIVPALQDLGRINQADKIFDTAYHDLNEYVVNAPADAMAKNNLAWLCACSGKRLEEAAKTAGEAVAAQPEDSACLDTQAETYSRLGQAGKALEIEQHALRNKPDDVYMRRQVERFRDAATKARQ